MMNRITHPQDGANCKIVSSNIFSAEKYSGRIDGQSQDGATLYVTIRERGATGKVWTRVPFPVDEVMILQV